MIEFLLAAVIGAGDFTIEPHKQTRRSGVIEVLYSLKNNTQTAYQRVYVSCTLFDASNKPVGIARGIAGNVHPGATIHDEATAITDPSIRPTGISCAVTQVAQ